MKIHDQQSCPQLSEDTARFEKTISPILQQLKKYAQSLPHSPAYEEEDWQDALIEIWQQLHLCPPGRGNQLGYATHRTQILPQSYGEISKEKHLHLLRT